MYVGAVRVTLHHFFRFFFFSNQKINHNGIGIGVGDDGVKSSR